MRSTLVRTCDNRYVATQLLPVKPMPDCVQAPLSLRDRDTIQARAPLSIRLAEVRLLELPVRISAPVLNILLYRLFLPVSEVSLLSMTPV